MKVLNKHKSTIIISIAAVVTAIVIYALLNHSTAPHGNYSINDTNSIKTSNVKSYVEDKNGVAVIILHKDNCSRCKKMGKSITTELSDLAKSRDNVKVDYIDITKSVPSDIMSLLGKSTLADAGTPFAIVLSSTTAYDVAGMIKNPIYKNTISSDEDLDEMINMIKRDSTVHYGK